MPRLWGGEVSACAEVAGRESTRILTDRDPRIRTQTPKPPRRIRPFVGAGQSQTVHPLPRTHRILLLPSPAHTAAWHPAGKCRHGGGSELRAGGFPGAIIAVPADEPRHRITSSRGTGYHTHTDARTAPVCRRTLLRIRVAAAAAEPLEIAVCLQVLPPPPPLAGRGDSGSGPVSCGGLRRRLHRCPGPGGGGRRSAHSPGFVHAPQYTLTYSNTVLFPSPAVCAATCLKPSNPDPKTCLRSELPQRLLPREIFRPGSVPACGKHGDGGRISVVAVMVGRSFCVPMCSRHAFDAVAGMNFWPSFPCRCCIPGL